MSKYPHGQKIKAQGPGKAMVDSLKDSKVNDMVNKVKEKLDADQHTSSSGVPQRQNVQHCKYCSTSH